MRGYGRLIGPDQASRVAKQPRAWPSRELDEPRALIPHAWSAGPGATAQIFLDCRAARGAPPRARSRSILSPPGFRELPKRPEATHRFARPPKPPCAETARFTAIPPQVVEDTTRRLPGRRIEGQINHGSRLLPHLGAHVRQERDAYIDGRTRWSRSVWKSTSVAGARGTGIATPSSRRRVDGVEDDAMIQHERAAKF